MASALITLIVKLFRFIIELIVDVICLALLLASFAAFWRIPFVFLDPLNPWDSRWNYRINALAALGAALLDFFVLPIAVATTFTHRGPRMWWDVNGKNDSSKFYNGERRLMCLMHGFFVLADVPFFVMLAITHALFWRIPLLWADLSNTYRKDGLPLFLNFSSSEWPEMAYRQVILFHFISALVEVLILPAGVVLLVTVYRVPQLYKEVEASKGTKPPDYLERKALVLKHFFLLLIDIPFAVMCVFCVITLFRCRKLLHDAREATKWKTRRWAILVNFVLTFRDLLVMPLIIPLLVTLYRGVFLVKALVDAVSPWAPGAPAVISGQCTFAAPDRGTGLLVHVEGTKADDFVLAPGTNVKLYIRNKEFWSSVSAAFGASIASVGQAMLPMALTPRYFDTAQITSGTTTTRFTIDFDTHHSTSTILKNIKKLGSSAEAIIQLEFGSHQGTLIALKLPLSTLDAHCRPGEGVPLLRDVPGAATQGEGQFLCDVFWKAVLIEFMWFMADIIGIMLFVVLHVFPHRMFRVYSSGCEGSERRRARRALALVQKAKEKVGELPNALQSALLDVDDQLKDIIMERPSGTQLWHGLRSKAGGRRGYSRRWHCDSRERRGKQVCTPVSATHFLEQCDNAVRHLNEQGVAFGAAAELTSARHTFVAHLLAFKLLLGNRFKHVNIASLFRGRLFGDLASEGSDQCITDGDGTSATRVGGAFLLPREAEVAVLSYEEQLQIAVMASLQPDGEAGATETAASETQSQPPQRKLQLPLLSDTQHAMIRAVTSASPASLADSMGSAASEHRRAFDCIVKDAAAALSSTRWCGGNEGWVGFRNTLFAEAGQLLYDFVAVLCAIVAVCTVYRAFSTIASVTRAKDRRKAAVLALAEVFVDILYLLKFGVTLCGVRGIITMPADIVMLVIRQPSFAVARQVIDHHFTILLTDILMLLSLVFAWDALRIGIATIVFGMFSPGVMLEGALSKWFEDPATGHIDIKDKSFVRAALLLIVSCAWMFGLPFFLAFFLQTKSYTAVTAVYFGVMGFVVWLGVAVALVHRDKRTVCFRRSVVQHLQPSLHNSFTFLAILIEGVQLMALVFSVADAQAFGGAVSDALVAASRYVFLIFGEGWAAGGLPFGIYWSLVASLVFFMISAMPIVVGDMLHWREADAIIISPLWIAMHQFFGQTCLLTVLRNMSLMFSCNSDTNTMIYSQGATCWVGLHRAMAVVFMVSLVYFIPSAMMRNMKYDEAMCRGLDVVYAQLYRLLTSAATATAVVLTLFFRDHYIAVLVIVLLASVWCAAWTLGYGRVLNRVEGGCCSVRSVQWLRFVMYTVVALSAIVMLIGMSVSGGSSSSSSRRKSAGEGLASPSLWPLYTIAAIVGLGLVAVVTRLCVNCHDAGMDDDGMEAVRDVLLGAESRLTRTNALVPHKWAQLRSTWRSQVAGCTRASPAALLMHQLEEHTYAYYLAPLFLRSRGAWSSKLMGMVDEIDMTREIDVDLELDGPDWVEMLLCCSCGVFSHLKDQRKIAHQPQMTEFDRAQVVLECVTAFESGIKCAAADD